MLRKSLTFMMEAIAVAVRDDKPLTVHQLKLMGETLKGLLQETENLRRISPAADVSAPQYAPPVHADLVDLANWFSRVARQGGVEMDRNACAIFSLAIRNMASRSRAVDRLIGYPDAGPQADSAGGVVPVSSRTSIDQLLQQLGFDKGPQSPSPAPTPAGVVA